MKQIQKNYMVPVLCTAIILGVSGWKEIRNACDTTETITQDILFTDLYQGCAKAEQEEMQNIYQLYEATNVAECAETFDSDEFKYTIPLEDYEALYEAELEEWIEHYISSLPNHVIAIQ